MSYLLGGVGSGGGNFAAGAVALRIGPGNFSTDTSISILPQWETLPLEASKPEACSYSYLLGSIYCCSPLGYPLTQGGSMRLYYDPAQIPPGFTEHDLVLLEWVDADGVLRPNLSADVIHSLAGNYLEDPSYEELGHVAIGLRDCPILVLGLPASAGASPPDGGYGYVVAADTLPTTSIFRALVGGTVAPQEVPTTGLVDAFVPSPTGERVLFRTSDGGILRDLWSSRVDSSSVPVGVGGLTDRLDPVESLFGWMRDAGAPDAFFAPFLSNYFAGLGGPDKSMLARRSGDAADPRLDLTSVPQCVYFDDLRQSAAGNLLLVRSYDYDNLASPWRLDVVEAAAGTPRVLDGFPSLARPEVLVGTYRRDNLRPAKGELYPWQSGAPPDPLQDILDNLTVSAGGAAGQIDAEPDQSPHSQFTPTGDEVTGALVLELAISAANNEFGIYDIHDPSRTALIFGGPSTAGEAATLTFLGDGSVDVTVDATTTNYPGVGREFGFFVRNPANAFPPTDPHNPQGAVYTEDVLNPECSPQILVYQGQGQTISLDGGATTETFVSTSWILACEDRLRRRSDQDYNDFLILVRDLDPVTQPAPALPSPAHLMPRWMSLQDRVYGIELDGQTIASFRPDGSGAQVLLTLGTGSERVLDVCIASDDETFAAVIRRLPPAMGDLTSGGASTQGTALLSDILVMGTRTLGVLGTLDLGEQVSVQDLLFLAAQGHVVAGLTGAGGPRVVHAVLAPSAPFVSLGADLGIASLDDLDISRDDGRLLLRRQAPQGLFVTFPDGSSELGVPLLDLDALRFARWVASTRTTAGMSGLGAHR